MSTCLIHGYFLRSRHFEKPRLFSREISTVLGFIIFLVKPRARSDEFQNPTFSKNTEIIQLKLHVESGLLSPV